MLFKQQNLTLFQQLDLRPPTNSTKVMNNLGYWLDTHIGEVHMLKLIQFGKVAIVMLLLSHFGGHSLRRFERGVA